MVGSINAAGQLLGIETGPTATDNRKGKAGSLLTAILLSGGREGCNCKCCRYAGQLADILLEDVDSPFPQPSPAPIPPTGASPPAPAGVAPSAPPAAPPAPPQVLEVNTEVAGV